MDKACPKCGRVFSEEDRFCDVDGEALEFFESEPPPRPWRRYISWGLLALVLVGVLVGGPMILANHLRDNVEFSLNTEKLLEQPLTEDADLTVPLKVLNKSGISFAIESAQVKGTILGVDIVTAQSSQKLDVPAQGDAVELPLSMKIGFADLKNRVSPRLDNLGKSGLSGRAELTFWGLLKTDVDVFLEMPDQGRLLSWLKLNTAPAPPPESTPRPAPPVRAHQKKDDRKFEGEGSFGKPDKPDTLGKVLGKSEEEIKKVLNNTIKTSPTKPNNFSPNTSPQK